MYLIVLCFVFVLLLSVCTYADDVYQVSALSENELMATYESMMLDACRHANRDWHDWAEDSRGGYWGNGISDGNEGIRAIGCMVFTCAALLKYSDIPKCAEREDLLRKSKAAILYAVSTHVTGTKNCVDGKKWGKSWQSGYWLGILAFGAWLIWDELDSELQDGVERVVAFEADRFLNVKPPSGRWRDSKAEENGWDMLCIAIAPNMFPNHPHAKAWDEKAIQYMMNVLSVAQDRKDSTIVDGKPVSEWVCTENLHPDFTLENHNMFHPSYVQCSSYFLTQTAMRYVYAGRPVPQAANHHLMDTWQMFQSLLLPSGETIYPQGQDWELHGLNPINLFACLGTYKKDPLAAGMEKVNIQYMRAWQKRCDGSLAAPGSRLGFTRHAIQAEMAANSYVAHKIFGPAVEGKTDLGPSLVRNYSLVGVLLHRTKSKILSFSWKYRIMGTLTPIGDGHEDSPFFTVPITNGFVGSTELSGVKDVNIKVLNHRWKKNRTGFETTGTLETNGGLLRQEIKVNSLGEKAVVYQDRITALSDVFVARELGFPIGIENDSVSGGKRTVYHQDGQVIFDWQKPQRTTAIPGTWANVDGRLGVIVAEGAGLAYSQAKTYNPQGVYADVLYGSYSEAPRNLKAGELMARRVVVVFTEVTPEETLILSKSVRIENMPDGQVLRFRLPEGGEGEVSLL